MNKTFKYICAALITVICGCSDYDDSGLQNTINEYKERIAALQQQADAISQDLAKLKYLTEGNVITGVTQNSDGQYVITYRDSNSVGHTIVVATNADVLAVPLLAVATDETDGLYYWTVVADGKSEWLMENGAKVPVCGPTPKLEVTADGYWSVNGQVLTDRWGQPISAVDGGVSVFSAIDKTDDGYLRITLASGDVITLEIFSSFNLKINTAAVTYVDNAATPLTVTYEVTGAGDATVIVAVAQAAGVDAALDTAAGKVTVTFPADFTEGHIILSAYDMTNVVLRPVIFKKK